MQARLDSGADITLMSEDFWSSIPGLPKPKEGLRMKLYHLTGSAKVLGYIRTTLFMPRENGSFISFDLEAYVVRNMRVPLLLGEDFQTTYELGVTRYATGHCDIHIGRTGLVVKASSAQRVDLGFKIRQAQTTQSFVRAKAARRSKWLKPIQGDPPVVAAEDVVIQPHSVKNVRVSAPFAGREDWLVEKVIIGSDDCDILAAPTTWITASMPFLPIANPGASPKIIRKGEIVGHLLDPSYALDKPSDESSLVRYVASADALRTVIAGSLKAQDLANATPKSDGPDDKLDQDDAWGPKTTAVPEDPVLGDLLDAVNLGPDVPEEFQKPLADVLRKNVAAFGINGRLGKVEAKVSIPLKEDASGPVSVPMYAASPAKREVIDKQMKAWFEAEVIEPSVSPWGFPVVVVYHNGKARLAIDYRKLNAQTIPDEFPIPRQSEIVQALSGAQVLSTFDALAGFTQLEMADEDKEKTAFRCHLGLWQFKRMPFGLRNGPSIFQRLMQGILAPYLWLFTLVYIDDIVVYSASWEDHITHLDTVLSAIAAAGIMLSPPKCFIGYSSILLLGQKVSRLGLSTHQEKV